MASTINATTSSGIVATADNTGSLALQTSGTTAVTINTTQYVGINNTSPASSLDVTGHSASNGYYNFKGYSAGRGYGSYTNSSGTIVGYIGNGGGGSMNTGAVTDFGISSAGNLLFSAGGSLNEQMRIDSSGHVYVGTTTFVPGEGNTATGAMIANTGKAFFSNGSDSAINANRNNDGGLIICRRSGNLVGSISVTSSATAYNTSSDYRLKENIVPMTGALDKVAQLKPVTYTWKADGSNGQGFIAHELQEVVPDCVTGEKDAVNEDGSINPQGIDTSKLVATLTAAIQEQQTIINNLKARIETLENK